ncbi:MULTISPECIES: MG2 domain-containing protein [unclassified Sphingomonas]|uniref:alpha-2-macroglobulin family protein n=1 Tax=unclassified Sphingomonas TaxID=196159 RepID=UPI0009279D12|nr:MULTISPECIES: MG2 domain-containing protein [unclassified Sphingomonas]MBN8849578.1 alpha-2-macroglobulin [Sphingomonas sp.]OJV31061.1 MAG: alpha-2-macroglobulin [Sphingomonas sp. 67-36]
MKLAAKLALLAAAIAPVAALSDNAPRVILAQPGIGGGAIERFTMRFSQPMAPLGDPRAAAPAKAECPVGGQGRWVDQQTWVYEFEHALPGGTTCKFNAVEGLKSVAGYALAGTQSFTVDAGGPVARAVLPSGSGNEIEEDQTFLVAANMPPDPRSVAANAYCAVDGIGEKIPVDVLPADLPGKLIGEMGSDRWEIRSFLESAGVPQDIARASAADRQRALAGVVALKCRRNLPPGRDMALVWGANIAGAGGKIAGTDQRFDYTVREPFTARFECSRVNPQAGCSPVEKAYVRFSAPVPMSAAQAIRIALPDGKKIAPVFSDDEKKKATIADVTFAAPLPYATAAKLELPQGVKDESGRALSNAERFPLDIRFDRAPPLVKFAAPFGIIEAKEGGVLPVTVRNVEPALQGRNMAVGGQALRVADKDGEVADWLRRVSSAGDSNYETVKRGDETVEINHTGDTSILGSKGAPLKVALPGKGRDFEVVGIPLGKPGFYVVELASPVLGRALLGRDAPRYVAAAALVTNMAVHFKWGRERSLAWVTALDSGKPVANANVTITDSCTGALLARGVTDRSGGVFVPGGLPEPETYGSCNDNSSAHPLMVSARTGGDFSFTLTAWGEGIRPYDFDLPYGYSKPEDVFHTVFDRALVRAGETIHMKHIVRHPVGAGFTIPAGFTGTLRLSHRGSDTEFDLPLTIDANGIGETSWTAPKGAPMGDYDLRVIDRDRTIYTNQSFRLDEYRLPTMRATVSGPKGAVVRPKAVPLDLFVGYLSGGGASNLPVDMRVGWFAHRGNPDGYDAYTFGGRAVQEGVKPLNGDGEEDGPTLPPTQTLPATLGADGTGRQVIEAPQGLDGTTDMTVEMDYQDANGQTLTASRTIPIFTSRVQLGVKTDGWLMKQDDLRLRFVALDPDGKPIKGQKINVAFYSRQILTARRRLIGGFYAYDNQMRTTKLSASCAATTDAQGLAQCGANPGVSGEVYAVATAVDADGNVSRAVRSVWLAGDDDWWFGGDNGDRMDVVPEQPAYKAGDTARFQVRMPFRSATALVTVEREGVLSSFVTELSGKDPVVEVKMPGSYAPDVYVSVMAVRGRVTQSWWGWFKSLFGARDEAPAATALVDLSKPAYRLGIAKVKVGWEAHTLGVTVKADRERYAARETAQVAIEVRGPDGKPARTADVAFAAVDQALLQLAPNDSWDVLTAMMGDRPLSVLTSTAQMQVVGKRHYGRKAVEAGGGGGADSAALNRENFQPVLLWKGRVALDANGRATVPVPLNDALTSFRLVAIATDGADRFGMGASNIRTAQDLSVYAGLPPAVRTGDRYAAGFTLRNGSDKPMTVTAEVSLTPRIATGKPLTVTIPAGGAAPIAWNLTAPPVAGNLRWQVSARASDGRAADKVTVTQEVVPAVPIEVWAATLTRVGADTSIPIRAPAGAIGGMGSVDIRLSDTLAPPMEGVRAFMAAYPYDCFEQQMSRVVALGDTAGWTRLAGEIPAYQAPDGLLRYWPSESLQGSEALTAYVLSMAGEAGLPIPEASKTKMVEGLRAVLDGRLRHEEYGDVRLQRLAAFAALARTGAATPAMLGQIGLTPAEMPTASLADYLMALDRVPGLANAQALRGAGENALRSRLVYEGTRLDLSDASNAPWWLMSSADEGSIKALLAVLGKPGWQDEAPKMMVGVASRQTRGRWDTTTANAWGALTVRRFAQLYPASAIAGTTTATLAGQSASFAWPLAADRRQASLPLPAGQAPLVLRQSGGEGPWATISVRAAVPLTQPLSAGYRLTRKVEVVQRRVPNQLTRGDVLRITLTVDATAERNWVVIDDPIPAGGTIVGDLGGQSKMLADQANAGDGVKFGAVDGGGKLWDVQVGVVPAYVERGNTAWRAFYAWVPRGRFQASYMLRLNGAGRFQMPPTRVEAMYSPAIHAAVPNQPIVVVQR